MTEQVGLLPNTNQEAEMLSRPIAANAEALGHLILSVMITDDTSAENCGSHLADIAHAILHDYGEYGRSNGDRLEAMRDSFNKRLQLLKGVKAVRF
jgi:hypothetical protein